MVTHKVFGVVSFFVLNFGQVSVFGGHLGAKTDTKLKTKMCTSDYFPIRSYRLEPSFGQL